MWVCGRPEFRPQTKKISSAVHFYFVCGRNFDELRTLSGTSAVAGLALCVDFELEAFLVAEVGDEVVGDAQVGGA